MVKDAEKERVVRDAEEHREGLEMQMNRERAVRDAEHS